MNGHRLGVAIDSLGSWFEGKRLSAARPTRLQPAEQNSPIQEWTPRRYKGNFHWNWCSIEGKEFPISDNESVHVCSPSNSSAGYHLCV